MGVGLHNKTMTSLSVMSALAVCLLVQLLAHLRTAAALSDSVCLNTAATWVSDSPHLTGQFPYYSLLFFCESGLNLESLNVDACVDYGSNCGQAAAEEFCQYLGFEGAAPTLYTTVAAAGPARSMSGEWCIQAGQYEDLGYLNRTQLDAVNSTINGPTCERLDSVVCYNSRNRLARNNQNLHAPVQTPQASPASAPNSESDSPDSQQSVLTAVVAAPAYQVQQTAVGGRRRLLAKPA